MENTVRPRELLSFIVGALVDKAEAVSIEEVVDDHSRVFKLRVDQSDIGRVIGKEGRTAKAIRTIIGVATARDGQKAKLDIVESD
jgi:uncharacterized protein